MEINVITLQLRDHKFCAQFPLIHIYSKLSLFTTAWHWHLLSVVKSETKFHTKQFKANFHMTGNIRTMLPLPIAQQRYAIYIYTYIHIYEAILMWLFSLALSTAAVTRCCGRFWLAMQHSSFPQWSNSRKEHIIFKWDIPVVLNIS